MAGAGVGWTFYPIIAEYIFNKYSFTATMYIFGSIMLTQIPVVAAIKEPEGGAYSSSSTDEETHLLEEEATAHINLKDRLLQLSKNVKVTSVLPELK